jgi:hypothetical protein
MTFKQAIKEKEIVCKVWLMHNLPEMRDCRQLNYGYKFIDNKIICSEGDTDITNDVNEYDYWKLRHDYIINNLPVEIAQYFE